ncbi:MAG: tRNA 2-thiouridine(34) synthase MnmA [Acidimicrobiia bacterium]|nr:tRNA 2-thiouridine(34) synthase MnmA [Acidimicrobiia bacterium]
MRVMAAMSGGVDSSVAAALSRDQGHDVVGVTLKLWGGESDSGCCSVSDVDDARRVAQQLGIDHHVFNFGDDFTEHVVAPYVAAHAAGRTPNPCVECNRHLKFDRLLERAMALGFDAVATGHHAQVAVRPDGTLRVARGADAAKDQSYVLHMLDQQQLARVMFPVGDRSKDDVRTLATQLGLRTATKPDSQDVCFITSGAGRAGFLADRMPLHAGEVVDGAGRAVGQVDAVELVTIGQRKGLGVSGSDDRRFAVAVDVRQRRVTIGTANDLLAATVELDDLEWVAGAATSSVGVQVSAHGMPAAAVVDGNVVRWHQPRRRVAPGQSVVIYEGDHVVGSGIARS